MLDQVHRVVWGLVPVHRSWAGAVWELSESDSGWVGGSVVPLAPDLKLSTSALKLLLLPLSACWSR